ncbi:uncharacterized protein BJX67DRAFT_378752 [Aspergillus lucknowensis]|uniref:Uncharacterized protein n=1 Tax=Aspergillus lucknowensis TaxID=176173 RepID=A0ABR4LYT5_9EURO
MKFTWIAALALIGSAMALPAKEPAKLPSGATCTKDGKLGICESGICVQDIHDSQGKCK